MIIGFVVVLSYFLNVVTAMHGHGNIIWEKQGDSPLNIQRVSKNVNKMLITLKSPVNPAVLLF